MAYWREQRKPILPVEEQSLAVSQEVYELIPDPVRLRSTESDTLDPELKQYLEILATYLWTSPSLAVAVYKLFERKHFYDFLVRKRQSQSVWENTIQEVEGLTGHYPEDIIQAVNNQRREWEFREQSRW